jgi:hypothetical protein
MPFTQQYAASDNALVYLKILQMLIMQTGSNNYFSTLLGHQSTYIQQEWLYLTSGVHYGTLCFYGSDYLQVMLNGVDVMAIRNNITELQFRQLIKQ